MSALAEFLTARLDEDEANLRLTKCAQCLAYQHVPGDPATERMLADVEAKRRIVARSITPSGDTWVTDVDTLHDLASVYADHPDYRDEWKP